MSNKRRYDITVYGATGFTGQYVTKYLYHRIWKENINIAIAGRNENKLNTLLTSLNNNDTTMEMKIDIIVANANDEESLVNMIKKSKIIIACVGPFKIYGEIIVKLCAQYGTNYVDICGEPGFMEEMCLKYYNIALNNKSIIVNACGFDCIPNDIGWIYLNNYYKDNNGLCCQINSYHTGYFPDGYSINIGTLLSIISSIKNVPKLRQIRKQIHSIVPAKDKREKVRRIPPKLKINKTKTYFYAKQVNRWTQLFIGADSACVSNSQCFISGLLKQQNGNEQIIYPYFGSYISFNGKEYPRALIIVGSICMILIKFKFGEYLVRKFPYFFTFGMFSKYGPTKKQINSATFNTYLFGKGYSKNNITNKFDMNFNLKVGGSDAAYIDTSKMVVECGITLLKEEQKIRNGDIMNGVPKIDGGVFTPSIVFGNTNLVERLKDNGMEWKIWDDSMETDDNLKPIKTSWFPTKLVFSVVIVGLSGVYYYFKHKNPNKSIHIKYKVNN